MPVQVLFTAGESGAVTLRDPHDLSVLHELRATSDEIPGGPGPLRCLAFSPAEDYVLAGTQGGSLLVWGSARGAEQKRKEDAEAFAAEWSELTRCTS